MLGGFNEATQLKTSLAKYSIEFNDLAVQIRPHRIAYLRLLGRLYTLTLLHVRRSVGRLIHTAPFSFILAAACRVFFRYSDYHPIFSRDWKNRICRPISTKTWKEVRCGKVKHIRNIKKSTRFTKICD